MARPEKRHFEPVPADEDDVQITSLAPAQPKPDVVGKPSIIEFSTEAREDPNEGRVFGDMPQLCACPHCERRVVTFIDYEASWVTWLLAFVVFVSLGWMSVVVLPLLWPAFKDSVHHCPRCLNVVARKSRISLPSFRTEVMTFKVGGCAVVLARKYVAILVALVGTILVVYLLRSTVPLRTNAVAEVPKGPPSNLTWEDFLFECGPRTSLRQRASTARPFEEKFRHQTFKWAGEVHTIREGVDVLFVKTKSVVMIRMTPPRHSRRELPDIALLFGEDRYVEVATLNPGDWVNFEATMQAHGYRGDPEVMTMFHIAVVPRPSLLGNRSSLAAVVTSNETEDKVSNAAGTGDSP